MGILIFSNIHRSRVDHTLMRDLHVKGKNFAAYLATPETPSPGLIVLHAWWGLTSFIKEFCNRLSKEGFVALAPDLYHGATASTVNEAKKLRSKLDRTMIPKELDSATDYLLAQPRTLGRKIGILGFSLGAYWAMSLADERPDETAAVVLFYGARKTIPEEGMKSQAAFLGHFAEEDEYESVASIRKLEKAIRSAGRDATFHVYPKVGHWFFEADRPDAYNVEAADIAWERTVVFLHGHLQTGSRQAS